MLFTGVLSCIEVPIIGKQPKSHVFAERILQHFLNYKDSPSKEYWVVSTFPEKTAWFGRDYEGVQEKLDKFRAACGEFHPLVLRLRSFKGTGNPS